MLASVFESTRIAIEDDLVNLGTVVDVLLPDGQNVVRGIRRGASASLSMEIDGYRQKRRDEVSVRSSEFVRCNVDAPTGEQEIQMRAVTEDDSKYLRWKIEAADAPDGTIWLFKLVQAW